MYRWMYGTCSWCRNYFTAIISRCSTNTQLWQHTKRLTVSYVTVLTSWTQPVWVMVHWKLFWCDLLKCNCPWQVIDIGPLWIIRYFCGITNTSEVVSNYCKLLPDISAQEDTWNRLFHHLFWAPRESFKAHTKNNIRSDIRQLLLFWVS